MAQNKLKEKVLIRTSWISTIGNLILSISKLAIGLIAGSLAVLSDGVDSAADVVISVIMICTAYIINKPPSLKFSYGYKKAECIATKSLSLILFIAGLQMCFSSVKALFSDEVRALPGNLAIYVTLFSIAGKLLLALYQYRKGEQVNSQLLKANAINMRNDVLISVSVLTGLVFTFVFKMPMLDLLTGLLISLFIMKSAIDIFRESYVELMDGVDNEDLYHEIFKSIEEVPEVSNPHRVRLRQIGDMYMVVLDVEVNGDISLTKAHELAHEVEEKIRNNIEKIYDIVVHVEPLGSDKIREIA